MRTLIAVWASLVCKSQTFPLKEGIKMSVYETPRAEKLEFNYSENVVASGTQHHGDMGHGYGGGGGCDHIPGHGNPKKPHP